MDEEVEREAVDCFKRERRVKLRLEPSAAERPREQPQRSALFLRGLEGKSAAEDNKELGR